MRETSWDLKDKCRSLQRLSPEPDPATTPGFREGLRKAINVIDKLVLDPAYSGHWHNGFAQAQTEAVEAIRALLLSGVREDET